ncbi:hypothetical protein EAG14_05070 [Acidovorax sp. 1608163]|nr:hypothetical protein EAG14_05070 [Acidovorax sp. 1608163]
MANSIKALEPASQQQLAQELAALLLAQFPALAKRLRTDVPNRADLAVAFSDEMDTHYFALQDAGDNQCLAAFELARAAAAVGLADSGDPCEAVYEALHAFEDPEVVLALVKRGLRDET